MIAYAQEAHVVAAQGIVAQIERVILFPLMTLMIAVAVLVFLYGVYEYILGADDTGAQKTGRTHMMYGVIGFVVMVSAYSILQIAASTFGVDVP